MRTKILLRAGCLCCVRPVHGAGRRPELHLRRGRLAQTDIDEVERDARWLGAARAPSKSPRTSSSRAAMPTRRRTPTPVTSSSSRGTSPWAMRGRSPRPGRHLRHGRLHQRRPRRRRVRSGSRNTSDDGYTLGLGVRTRFTEKLRGRGHGEVREPLGLRRRIRRSASFGRWYFTDMFALAPVTTPATRSSTFWGGVRLEFRQLSRYRSQSPTRARSASPGPFSFQASCQTTRRRSTTQRS